MPIVTKRRGRVHRIEYAGWGIYVGLLLLPFAARGIRAWYHRRRRPPMLAHAGGRSVPILPGATVLETLRKTALRMPRCAAAGRAAPPAASW